MSVVAWVVGVALTGLFSFAGVTKLIDLDRQRERFGYTAGQFRLIGLAEVAAVVGVLGGLIWRRFEWAAVAAGIGICALMLGALLTHARVEDTKEAIPAAVVFVLSVIFVIAIASR